MASPDKGDKPAPESPAVQDSPTFGYLASLSPLQLVNMRPTLYENIDVPSPQLIFKTPNFNRPRKSTVLERSQHSTLADAENLSPGYANCRVFSQSMNISRSSVSLSTANTTSCINKEEANGNPSPNDSCTSPSNCVDAFLADPLENGDNSSSSPDLSVMGAAKDIQDDRSISSENQMKCLGEDLLEAHPRTTEISVNDHIDDSIENSMPLGLQHLKQGYFPPHYPQSDSIRIEEPSSELNIADGNSKHTSRKAFANSGENQQSKEDPGIESLTAETMQVNKELIGEEGPISKNDTSYTKSLDVSDSFTQSSYCSRYNIAKDQSFVSTAKECDIDHYGKNTLTTSDDLLHGEQDLKLQTDKSDQSDELDCTLQLHPVSSQNTGRDDDHTSDFVQTFSAVTPNQNSYDQEDGAHLQRGKRKRLQFEAVENLRIANSTSCNYTTGTSIVDLPNPPLEVEKVNVSHAEPIMFSSNKQAIQTVPVTDPFAFPVKVDKSGQYQGCPLTVPRPSGIGLHLNSIGSTASIKCHSNIHVEKPACEDRDNAPQRTQKDPSSMCLIGPAKLTLISGTPFPYVGNNNDKEELKESQTFKVSIPFVDQPPLSVKPLNVSMPFKHIDRYMTPCTAKSLPSEEVSRSEESTHTSPKKKRKKGTENDGQKRCNCKRSKCLKLYCDCFAAGSFCSDACACRECSNRVEHQDAVVESRQQIESRNPLAFAPKVVVRVSNPPKDNEDSKPITPSSARHKSGCNCKKSLCLKKYCECFQAGVGCSAGCRCEGCKNTFGKKDGCDISEMIAENRKPREAWERDLSGELEGIEVKRQLSDSKHCHSGLSPLTPVVQSTNGNDVSKPHLPARYYPSPESSSADMDSIKKGDSASFISYDPSTSIDPFSPGWEGFPDLCNFSPLLKFSPNPGCSSSSTSTSERKVLQMKLFEESSRISLGSLSWQSSPITPVPLFGESKPVHCSNPEDDTPEILKEGDSPIKAVTTTSPNQKRVSPPHQVACSSNSNSSSKSLAGVRSVRKFILHSVPSFPPLTPYSISNRQDGA